MIRDTVAVFKKETQLLIESGDISLSDIDRIDIADGGDHGQEPFQFSIKILYIMSNEKILERIQPVGYILYKTDNGLNIEKYSNQRSRRLN